MFGLTTNRRLRRDLAAAKAETERQRDRANDRVAALATAKFNLRQVLNQNAELDAANRRLTGRNLELGRRLTACGEADPEYAARLERRVARLLLVGSRLMAAGGAEKRRADHLQERLDHCLGLDSSAVALGQSWQSRRDDKRGLAKDGAS